MDFLTDYLRQEAGDLPQPDLHPDFCDEVLQSLTEPTTYKAQYPTNQETYQHPKYPTSYQEPKYPTHQTYQLPDQHHKYPTSTTNTTDQPLSNHKCLELGNKIKNTLTKTRFCGPPTSMPQ